MKKTLGAASLLCVTCLYGLLAAILILVFALTGVPILYALITGIVILLIQFLINPWLTDLSMKWFYKADFNPGSKIPDELWAFIEKTCEEQKMKMPKIGFIEDRAPNAFTYGRTKNDARIVITRGILEMLDEEEAKTVIAHEIGHAAHYDMLIMTVAQLVPLVLYAIYDVCLSSKSSNEKGNGLQTLVGAIAYVLYIICQYIILFLSRAREYYADDFSARTTGNPNALSSALVKIGFGLSTCPNAEGKKHSVGSTSSLGIADSSSSLSTIASVVDVDGTTSKETIKNAMKWDLWNTWAKWYELNATHPLISKRILKLGETAKELGQMPFVEFNEKPDKSYFPKFLGEVILSVLPTVTVILGIPAAFLIPDFIGKGAAGESIGFSAGVFLVFCIIAAIISLMKFYHRHPNKFKAKQVKDLMQVVEVSDISPIPCVLTGEIIGRGDPGCIFSENFVVRDESGIVLLNYKQPLKVMDKLFALLHASEYIGKQVTVTGWFRRSPSPYVDMLSFEVGDKKKKLYRYTVSHIFHYVLIVLLIMALIVFRTSVL